MPLSLTRGVVQARRLRVPGALGNGGRTVPHRATHALCFLVHARQVLTHYSPPPFSGWLTIPPAHCTLSTLSRSAPVAPLSSLCFQLPSFAPRFESSLPQLFTQPYLHPACLLLLLGFEMSFFSSHPASSLPLTQSPYLRRSLTCLLLLPLKPSDAWKRSSSNELGYEANPDIQRAYSD